MGVLDQVTDMQRQGMSDQKIINRLEEEGFAPKEVRDALNHAQIKNAVSKDVDVDSDPSEGEAMQPSIMGKTQQNQQELQNTQKQKNKKGYYDDDLIVPSPNQSKKTYPKTMEMNEQQKGNTNQESYGQEQENYNQGDVYTPMPQYSNQQYAPQQEMNYNQQRYGQENYSNESYTDTDTMIEIAEQVFSEKLKPHLKKIEEATEFKVLAETKLEHLSTRLARIENQIDNLQAAILEKIGSYGRGLDSVKKEIGMVEDSFGKLAKGLKGKHHKKSGKGKKSKTITVHKSTKTSRKTSKGSKKTSKKK